MGSRGLAAKMNSRFQTLSEYGVRVDMRTYRGTNKELLDGGLEGIQTLMKELGVSKEMMPFVDIACMPMSYSTLGKCQLNSTDDDYNSISINKERSTGDDLYNRMKILGTYTHEYIHALESMLIKYYLPNSTDRINAWTKCRFAEQIISKAIKDIGGNTKYWRRYAGRISDYAKTDHSECLAEVGSAYTTALKHNFQGYTKSEVKFMKSVMKNLKTELGYLKNHKRTSRK